MRRQRKGGEERRKNKALGQDKRAETQGHFYRLTVASEESAVRFHPCKTSRCAAAERAPGNSCAQMLALARGGSRTCEAPPALCSSNPQRQLPSERPAPSPWLEMPLRYDSSFISLPHPHATACPARRLRPSTRAPAPRWPWLLPDEIWRLHRWPSLLLLLLLQLDNDASFPVAGIFSRSASFRQGFQKTPSAANPSSVISKSRKGP